MPIPRTEMSRRLMRWMLAQTAPAPLPLEHPAQQDMAEAADLIDMLTRGSRAALASIHTRIGQIEKAFKPFTADSYYQLDVAVGQLRDAANILNNVLTARMLGPPQPECTGFVANQAMDVKVGDRIASAPHTLAWRCGDRSGKVEAFDGNSIMVRMDQSGRLVPFRKDQIQPFPKKDSQP